MPVRNAAVAAEKAMRDARQAGEIGGAVNPAIVMVVKIPAARRRMAAAKASALNRLPI